MSKNCNPDYHGGMICRAEYAGTEWEKVSACTRHGGIQQCLLDIQVPVKRDWLSIADENKRQ